MEKEEIENNEEKNKPNEKEEEKEEEKKKEDEEEKKNVKKYGECEIIRLSSFLSLSLFLLPIFSPYNFVFKLTFRS